MMSQIRGQNQFSQSVNAFLELDLRHAVENATLLLIDETNRLREMMSLVHTTLAAIQSSQWTFHLHLEGVVRSTMVKIMAEACDQQ